MKSFLLQKRQFLLYCVIGASGVTLDFGIYSLLVKSGLLDYQAANAIGYASGTYAAAAILASMEAGGDGDSDPSIES